MNRVINIFRWFFLGLGVSILTDDLVGATLFLIFVVLNFEERDWSKILK